MSELARAEAEDVEREDEEQAEAEDVEREDGNGEGGEPEAAAPELPTFDPKRLEAEQRRHEKALEAVFGGLDPFDSCDACGGLGIVPKGLADEPEVLAHPKVVRCEACNGHGIVRTGSLHPQYMTIPCEVCTGVGYRDRDAIAASERAAELSAAAPPPLPPPPPTWDASRQAWVDASGLVIVAASGLPASGYVS